MSRLEQPLADRRSLGLERLTLRLELHSRQCLLPRPPNLAQHQWPGGQFERKSRLLGDTAVFLNLDKEWNAANDTVRVCVEIKGPDILRTADGKIKYPMREDWIVAVCRTEHDTPITTAARKRSQ